MSVKDFRFTPLSDKIIHELINTTQAYSSMDILINEYPATQPILYGILLSLDIYYDFYAKNPNIADICKGLYIQNQENEINRNAMSIRACFEYASDRMQQTGVLTSSDIIKIDRTVKSSNIDYLSIDDYCGLSYNVNSMWTILHNLYEPQPQYPLLLETAIACYELITISSDYNFSLQTLCVLFSSLHKSPLTFQGLERQWVLFTDPRINIGSLSIEDSLIHILKVFQLMWLYTATLIRKINIKKDELSQLIKSNYFQLESIGLSKLLAENICVRNQDVMEKLHVSKKSAIKYLKQLEQSEFLSSIKHGREVYYFNNTFLDLLNNEIEVDSDGT